MTDAAETSIRDVSAQMPGRFQRALTDLVDGAGRWQLWLAFAWEDIRSTYRRSLFGVMWITLAFAAFIGVKLLIFRPIMGGQDAAYFGAYLLLGFFAWQFITAVVSSAPIVFTSNEGWIKNDPIPYSVYVFQSIAKHLFNFFFTFLVVIGFYWYFDQGLSWHALLFIPAIGVYVLNAIWVKLLLGVVCTRFRDLTHLVHTIMRMMFFLVPIFWFPAQMGGLMTYLWWNPFAHFLWILRTPVLDKDPAIESWIFVGVVTVVGWIAAFIAFALYRRRVPFWF